jgi:hypothetical protein
MLKTKNTRRFHWFGAAAIGALALTATAVPLTQAKAQIGVEVGPVGIGVGGPYYGGYYGPGPYGYYGYGPYYHHHYRGW